MAKSANSLLRQLRRRYIAALGLIAFLILAGQFLIQIFLGQHAGNTELTNLISDQIARCREIGRDTTSYQFAADSRHLNRLAEDILGSLERLKSNHETLRKLSDIHGWESEIEKSFQKIDPFYEQLKDGSAETRVRAPSYDRLYLAQQLTSHLDAYRMGLESAFTTFQSVNTSKIHTLQATELVLVILTIIVLILEGFFVFNPAIKSLETSLAGVLEARAEAERALRIKSDFLGKMSHEIKNPLNAIVGMSELMLDTRLSPDQKRFSNILFRSASGLRSLLESLLDFSKIEAKKLVLEKVPFELFPVIEKSVDIVAPGVHEKGVELIIDMPPNLCFKTEGDPTRLQQVLVNLLTNASKFTKEGEITLSVARSPKAGSLLRFAVKDTGCGIKEDEATQIFEEFSQANTTVTRMYGGTGLGLAISKQIVEAWGGKLEFTSAVGVGSEFFFELSLPDLGRTEALDRVQSVSTIGKTLIVSPNAALRDNIAASLKVFAAIATASDEPEARQALNDSRERNELFRNIILDNRLLDSTILSFVQEARGRGAENLQVFLLLSTAHASDQILSANYFGITRFLFKPLGPLQLLKEIDPDAPESTTEETARPTRTDFADQRPLRILAADDSRDNRHVLEAYFSQTSYLVDYAKNGELALELYRKQRYDLVLMDIEMPVVNGYEAAKIIAQLQSETAGPKTPVIALTAYDLDASRMSNFAERLNKPLDRARLFEVIQRFTTHIKPPSAPVKSPESITVDERLLKLVPKYVKDRKQEFEGIRTALDEKRFDDIARIGHNLKGSAPNYGFPILAMLGDKLYAAAREQDRELIEELTTEMQHSLIQDS